MARTTGTAREVVQAFMQGESLRTRAAHVPGGRRVTALAGKLYSYNTLVAARVEAQAAVTTRRYSVTTAKLLSRVRSALRQQGYEETVVTVQVEVNNPGRWGGFGPAWGPDYSTVPFVLWTRPETAKHEAGLHDREASPGCPTCDELMSS